MVSCEKPCIPNCCTEFPICLIVSWRSKTSIIKQLPGLHNLRSQGYLYRCSVSYQQLQLEQTIIVLHMFALSLLCKANSRKRYRDYLKLTPSNAGVKGHLEPTHLKSSPLFTFSTKSLGQDSPTIHLFSKIIGSRFTTAKIKLGEDSPS